MLEAQNPRSGRSLSWILVTRGMEAHFSGRSLRGNSYTSNRRSWGDVLQFLHKNTYVLWTFFYAYLLKVPISLILTPLGLAFTYVFLRTLYIHLGISEKKITFNIVQVLSHCEVIKSTISHSSTSKCLDVCVVDVYHKLFFTGCLGGFCLRNTSGNAQLQEWNLITVISYIYFYDNLCWSNFGK